MNITQNEKWLLLGASSGFGAAFFECAQKNSDHLRIQNISRRSKYFSADFSNIEDWSRVLEEVQNFSPDRLLYFAGGGPWGPYPEKKWSSHGWTFRVNFLFPAFLLHHLQTTSAKQVLFVGSQIAEARPDPGAASYSAAKHGLKGLVTSLQAEKSLPFDLRLYSPGYLDTPLLPANAWPRQQKGLVRSTSEESSRLFSWIQDVQSANQHLATSDSLS